MKLENIKRVYFIGVGGIGMSALARYFQNRGILVCGYDKTATKLTNALEHEGILIRYIDDESAIPVTFFEADPHTLIVYTPAIPKDSVILNYFKQGGFNLKKRSEVLGIISSDQFCIAVAGTHGKTTTSALIAHVLVNTGHGCTAFVGGIAANYESNFLIGQNNVVVVEADEYDRSFLTLTPNISVITSTDADHLDIYENEAALKSSFLAFASKLKSDGVLFAKDGLNIPNAQSYGVNGNGAIRAENIRIEKGVFVFDYKQAGLEILNISLSMGGLHNVENAVAAIAVAVTLGIDLNKIKAAIGNFKGVKRRFERVYTGRDSVYIDDYAHHPTELKASFDAARLLYPERKLTVVFQPHLYSRTRDFGADFAAVLSTVDQLLLLDIYPARELPIEGIDSAFLLNKITIAEKEIVKKENLKDRIKELMPELLLTVGAGDIDAMVEPLKNMFEHA